MKRMITTILAAVMVVTLLSGCGSKKAVAETAEMTAARDAFSEGLKTLYSCPNGRVFGQYISGLKTGTMQESDLLNSTADLDGCTVKDVASETLFVEGEYTVYDAVLLAELATGERRIYHEILPTVQVDGAAKIVLQENIPAEVQTTLIEKMKDYQGTTEAFQKQSMEAFCANSKGFASFYEKVKDSMKTFTTSLCLTEEVRQMQSPSTVNDRKLVWSEEFENCKALSETKMGYATSMSADDVKLTRDDSNLTFKDGTMIMTTRRDPSGKYFCTMPDAISTWNKMFFLGGYLEMRAKVPFEFGAWPSFWMKSDGPMQTADYMSEIDIFEGFGSEVGLSSAMHKWGRISHVSTGAGNYKFESNEIATDWHTYGFEWTEEEVKFYVDETCYGTVKIDEESDFNIDVPGMGGFHDYHYFMLNNFAFTPKGNQNYVKSKMNLTEADTKEINYQVDYIRLYQNPNVDKIMTY